MPPHDPSNNNVASSRSYSYVSEYPTSRAMLGQMRLGEPGKIAVQHFLADINLN
jgi:hypothetical protein